MELRPLSDIIQEVLSGFDDELKAVGAVEARKEKLGERSDALNPKFAAATGGGTGSVKRSGVRLAWVNPTALRKPAGRRTSAGLLKIVQ